jgi:hypothetical protein
MKVGVLGTGVVGRTLASKLVELGYDVLMGSREAANEKAAEWLASVDGRGATGTFAEAAAHGEMLLNCTAGVASVEALASAAAEDLDGKVLLDVANPLDFSHGMPPTLTIAGDDSLGETLQRTFPQARVVKGLNTVNAHVMVDPARVPGEHVVYLCGNDEAAKGRVEELLRSFGWREIVDLGDISGARGTEGVLPLWVRLMGVLGTADFNFQIRRA